MKSGLAPGPAGGTPLPAGRHGDPVGFSNDDYCFVCGGKNPLGFKLAIAVRDGHGFYRVTIPKEYQGWRNVVHGGIITTLLDEVMVNLCWQLDIIAVTGKITVRFIKPVATETEYQLEGWITGDHGKVIETAATWKTLTGEVMARAEAKLIRIEHERSSS